MMGLDLSAAWSQTEASLGNIWTNVQNNGTLGSIEQQGQSIINAAMGQSTTDPSTAAGSGSTASGSTTGNKPSTLPFQPQVNSIFGFLGSWSSDPTIKTYGPYAGAFAAIYLVLHCLRKV